MQTTRNRGQALLFETMAYALAGIFLLTVSTGLILCILGWVFIAFATFLIIESFFNRPISGGDKVHTLLSIPLFAVTVAEFAIESAGSQQTPYIILAAVFLLFLLSAISFQIWRIFWRVSHQVHHSKKRQIPKRGI
jgi:hypothetical protein